MESFIWGFGFVTGAFLLGYWIRVVRRMVEQGPDE